MMRRKLAACSPVLLILYSLFAQNKKDEGWSDLLPPGAGRELVLNSCSSCHNLKVVVHARLNRAAWTKSINDMIQRGAPVFTEDIDPITSYLCTAFGPAVLKLVNVNTAGREDVEKRPLKPEIVTRILEARDKAGLSRTPKSFAVPSGWRKPILRKTSTCSSTATDHGVGTW